MRVLLVEDDSKIAQFLTGGLERAGHRVVHTTDGLEGYDHAESGTFDVGVFDIMLPGLDGLSIVKKLRASEVKLPVLFISAKRSVDDRIKGLTIGGDDYLTKPFVLAELVARLEALHRRARDIPSPIELSIADLTLNIDTRQVYRADKRIELQPREYDLLRYLMENKGKVVSKTTIIERVWNFNFDPQTNVVEARICKLRDKIDRDAVTKLIKTVRGVGYVIRDDNE